MGGTGQAISLLMAHRPLKRCANKQNKFCRNVSSPSQSTWRVVIKSTRQQEHMPPAPPWDAVSQPAYTSSGRWTQKVPLGTIT